MKISTVPVIVHIDDRESNRYAVRRFLQESGFEVHQAETGKEGFELVKSIKPDLAILDIQLPDISGYELCRQIKKDPETHSITVLQVSAHFTDIESRVEGLESGADAYLTSISATELLATVKALLRARAAEDAALAVAAEWNATFNSVSDPIVLLDSTGAIKKMNRAGNELIKTLDPSDKELLYSSIANNCQFDSGECCNSQFELHVDSKWFRLSYDRVSSESQSSAAYVCVMVDVSELKRAEMEIRRINDELILARDAAIQANRAKSAFLASMSHELRTPLNAIMGYTDILKEDLHDGRLENAGTDLSHISSSAEHLLGLVTELLDLSRIESGRTDISRDSFDLSELCDDVLNSIRPLATHRGNDVICKMDENLGSIWTDAAKLRQILLNLLSNSCKFTSNGSITLKIRRYVEKAKDVVEFAISDTGIGIPADKLETIFEAYQQASPEILSHYGGTGLGLAISKRLADILGGNLTVTSILGKGSTFSLTVLANIEERERKSGE